MVFSLIVQISLTTMTLFLLSFIFLYLYQLQTTYQPKLNFSSCLWFLLSYFNPSGRIFLFNMKFTLLLEFRNFYQHLNSCLGCILFFEFVFFSIILLFCSFLVFIWKCFVAISLGIFWHKHGCFNQYELKFSIIIIFTLI